MSFPLSNPCVRCKTRQVERESTPNAEALCLKCWAAREHIERFRHPPLVLNLEDLAQELKIVTYRQSDVQLWKKIPRS